jgi:hypothetical protein
LVRHRDAVRVDGADDQGAQVGGLPMILQRAKRDTYGSRLDGPPLGEPSAAGLVIPGPPPGPRCRPKINLLRPETLPRRRGSTIRREKS